MVSAAQSVKILEDSKAVRINVSKVLDGDTLDAWTADSPKRIFRIRLRGIDAPEMHQPLGKRARARLDYLTKARPVYMREVGSDHYGRITAYLYIRASNTWTCINVALVGDRLAYAYIGHGGESPAIQDAEFEAKFDRRGVWSEGRFGDEKPWDNRNADEIALAIRRIGRAIGNWVSRKVI